MSRTRTFKWVILVTFIIIGSIMLGAAAYIYTEVSEFDKIFAENIWINETKVSGLTREEALKKIKDQMVLKEKDQTIILYKGDIVCEIPFSQLGFKYNMEEVLDQAYAIGHNGNMLQRYYLLTHPTTEKQQFEMTSSYEKENVEKIVASFSEKFYKAPTDATISRKNRTFLITEELPGEELDLGETLKPIYKALEVAYEQPIKVEAVTKAIPAQYTKESFKDIQNVVASFYTSYNNSDANRNINLKVASEKINIQLLPGEVFSLSEQLEPITYDAGYRASKVIVNGKLEQGIGGGICQIASTLYNALLLTDIEISMRQNHSLPVAYVPLGRDATYATGAIDFKFKNSSQAPLFIESYCENNKVFVNVFAHTSLKPSYDIKFDSVTTEVIKAPETKYVDDDTLEKGIEVEELKPLDGKRVKLYKLYYDGEKLVKKEIVNNSYYRPRGGIIKVGTKVLVDGKAESESEMELAEEVTNDMLINDSTIINQYEEPIQ